MSQETMNVALPETMKEFVLQQVSEGGYSTASEYIRELIRSDQKRRVAQHLDNLLLKGLDSGRPAPLTKKDWADVRKRVNARLKKNRRK